MTGKATRRIERGDTKYDGIRWRRNAAGKVVYEIVYRDSLGKQRQKTIGSSITEARAALEDVRGRIRRGEKVSPSRATLAVVVDEYLAQGTANLRPRTRETYTTALMTHAIPRLGRVRISEIEVADIAKLVADLNEAGKAAWTVRGVLGPLSRVFAFALRRGYVSTNPVKGLDKGERPKAGAKSMRVLDAHEIEALLAAATTGRWRVAFEVSIFAGIRQGELLGLTWGHVDLAGRRLTVTRQLDRSGSFSDVKTAQSSREVEIGDDLVSSLAAYRLSLPPDLSHDDALVIATADGKPISWRNASRAFQSAARAADIAKVRWHDQRHSFASILISGGLDVTYVAAQMGHADPGITLRTYSHLFQRAKHAERARSVLDGVLARSQSAPPRKLSSV